jgi:uncharacterized protein (DUF2147 family)
MNRTFKYSSLCVVCLLLHTQFGFSQSILGKWKTIDDLSGKEKGIVEVYEKSGLIYARILDIFETEYKNKKCSLCAGQDKDKPLLGLIFIRGLKKDGDEYNGGKVLDPKIGKYYKCYIKLEDPDKLKIRGYVGIPMLGRTQYWYRVKK